MGLLFFFVSRYLNITTGVNKLMGHLSVRAGKHLGFSERDLRFLRFLGFNIQRRLTQILRLRKIIIYTILYLTLFFVQ